MFKPGPVVEAFYAYSEAQKIMIQSVYGGQSRTSSPLTEASGMALELVK